LTKRNRNTLELLAALSDRLGVPFERFSYGARKDRRALTHQFIAIEDKRRLSVAHDDYSLVPVGRMDRPMGPDLIVANDFILTVRSLDEAAACRGREALAGIRENGFANYFDDQRFGCLDPVQGFWAEKLLKKQFNGALKIYLTGASSSDDKKTKERKRFFFDRWRDWPACLEEACTPFEKKAFAYLREHPKDFFPVLKNIPHHEATLFISAYQSFLWNKMLRCLLEKLGYQDLVYEGVAGPYFFWRPEGQGTLSCSLPMPGLRPVFEDPLIKEIYGRVLEDEGLRQALFNKVVPRSVYFKSFPRPAVARPEDLKVDISADDLHPQKTKLTLSFRLPRGCFATMMVKAAFADPAF